ncbi:autotransporter outer membrane beta-barrel domain-containing protein [Sutterella megalosphaeroides]|nr:autotransporter outer membrane beta-barrel domain-containing protein [Sutterella megalosphaeroides]
MKPTALALLLGTTLAASSAYADPWEQSDTWEQWTQGTWDQIHVYDYTSAPQRYSHINTDFYFGSNEEARYYQSLDITMKGNTGGRNFTWTFFLQDYNGRAQNFAKKNQAANDTGMLLAQSEQGLVQQIIRVDDLTIEKWGDRVTKDSFRLGTNHYGNEVGRTNEKFYQGFFEEDGTVSAVAEYGMGPDAVRFFGRYALQEASIDRFGGKNATAVTVDGLEFGNWGVAAKTQGEKKGFYMLAVLRSLELQRGATFTFSDTEGAGSGNFTAYLTGAGNLALVGDPAGDSTLSFVTFNDLYAIHDKNDSSRWLSEANNYQGSTTIANYTVNATRASVFGKAETADVNATASRVNVRASGVFDRVQHLTSDNSVFNWDFGSAISNHALAVAGTTLIEGETNFAGRGALTLTTGTLHVDDEGSLVMNGVADASALSALTVNANTALFETATPFGKGKSAIRLNVGNALILSNVGSDDPVDFTVSALRSDADGFVFRLENSDIRLGDNTIAASETKLIGSNLSTTAPYVGRQLGETVRFDDASSLTVAGTGAWTLSELNLRATDATTATEDSLLLLSAGGIGNAVAFSNVTTSGSSAGDAFRGDIRFEDASYILTTRDAEAVFGTAGLGLGRNSRVAWSGTVPAEVSRLVWDGGELDLSDFTFSNATIAALNTGELDLRGSQGSVGSIRVNASAFSQGSHEAVPESGHFHLGLDNGNFIQLLVEADRFETALLPELVSENFDGKAHTADYKAENSSEVVAKGHWNFGLMAVDDPTMGGRGIGLGYRLNEIELLPGHTAPLVLDGTNPRSDRTLAARVTGNGKLEVRGSVLLAPSSANTFTGSVFVTEGSTLGTGPVSGALGSGTTVLTLGKNVLFTIAEDVRAQSYVESIGRLVFSDTGGARVDLNGSILALTNGRSVFTDAADLKGTDDAILRFDNTGSALFENVKIFDEFEGSVAWNSNAVATTTISDDAKLTSGHFVSRNALGGRDLVLDVDADLSDALTFKTVDMTLRGGHVIRALTDDARLSLAGSHLTLESGSRYEQGAWTGMQVGGLTTLSGSTLRFENPLLEVAPSLSASGNVTLGSGTVIDIAQGATAVNGAFVLLHDETTRNTLISAGKLNANVGAIDLRGEENFSFTLRENGKTVGNAYVDGIRLEANATDLNLVYRITKLDLTENLTLDAVAAEDRTLSAQLTGAGGVTVSRGTVTFTNGTSRVGHVNVDGLGTLALGNSNARGTLRLTGDSAWEGAVTGLWTVALEKNATLTLGKSADLTGYSGTIDLASGSLLNIGTVTTRSLDNASLRLAADSTVRLSNNYSLLSSFYAGSGGKTEGGTLDVCAPYAYLGRNVQRGGLSHLTLGSEVREFTLYGAIDRNTATGAGVDVDVSGRGTLSLLSLAGSVDMSSEHTNLTDFAGTVDLKGRHGSSFTFATGTGGSALPNSDASKTLFAVASGSSLNLTGDGSAVIERLTLDTGSTLDFGSGLAHLNLAGNTASTLKGTIRISKSRVERKTAESPLLDLDEGIFDLLVRGQSRAPSLSGSSFVIAGDGISTFEGDTSVETKLSDGVTAFLSADLTTQNGGKDVGGFYRLTEVRTTKGSELLLDRGNAVDPNTDLETVIRGEGTLRKTDDSTVTLRALDSSDFAGNLDVRAGTLKLETESSYVFAGSRSVVGAGARLDVSSDQEMALVSSGTVSLTEGARWNLLGSTNVLTNNARLTGDGSLAVGANRLLRIDTADGGVFSGFTGTIELDSAARAVFANRSRTAIDLTDTLAGSRTSTATLERGAFAFGSGSAFEGDYAVSGEASLDIHGLDPSGSDFFEVRNRLTGTGTLTTDGRVSLSYGSLLDGNERDVFSGTWVVNENGYLKLGLRDGADMHASGYAIGRGATLEIDFESGNGFQNIASVNAGKPVTGTLRFSGPQHVDLAERAQISLDALELTEGAVYHATSPSQTAQTNFIDAGSTLILDGRADTDGMFVLSGMLEGRTDSRTLFSGDGRLEILMPTADTIFAFHGELSGTEEEQIAQVEADALALFGPAGTGFTGTLHIAGGTYLYRNHDSRLFERIGDFSLGQGATLNFQGSDTLTLPTLSFRPAVNVAGDLVPSNPVLDLSAYRGNTVLPDGSILYTPAASVGRLTIETQARIVVDPEEWIHNGWGSPEQDGSILDIDTSNLGSNHSNYVQLIAAMEIEGSGTLDLVDTEGNPVGGTNPVTTEFSEEGRVVAKGYWSYTASIQKDPIESNGVTYEPGVYVGYGIRELHLLNADDTAAPFVFNALEANDHTFDARITGNGRFAVVGDVTLNNRSNDFTGTVLVNRGSTLNLAGGSWVLGGYENAMNAPVLVELGDGARLSMEAEHNYERFALRAGTGSRVDINDLSVLTLAEADLTASSVIAGGTTSTLVIDGNVVMHDAVTQLSEFEGTLALEDDPGTVLTMRGAEASVGEDFVVALRDLSNDHVGIEGETPPASRSNAIVRLERSARIGDAHGFTGTFDVAAGADLTVYGSGDNRSQIHPNASIRLSSRGRADNESGALTGSTLNLIDANATLYLLESNAGSTITLGSAAIGGEASSSGLTLDTLRVNGATDLKIEIDPDRVDRTSLLMFDNPDGAVTNLITAKNATGVDEFLTVSFANNDWRSGEIREASLMDGNVVIGTVDYEASLATSSAGESALSIGLRSRIDEVTLWGELKLDVPVSTVGNDAELSAAIKEAVGREGDGSVTVTGAGTLRFSAENRYGSLELGRDATLEIAAMQTLTGTGGVIEGFVTDSVSGVEPSPNAGALLTLDKAELTFRHVPTGLANGIAMNAGSVLTIEGDGIVPRFAALRSGHDHPDTPESYVLRGLTLTQGSGALPKLNLVNVSGRLGEIKREAGAERLRLALTNSDVRVNSDTYAQLADVRIGTSRAGSTLTVADDADRFAAHAGSEVSVDVGEKSELHLRIENVDSDVRFGSIGRVTGTGTVHFDFENSSVSHDRHALILDFTVPENAVDMFAGDFMLTNAVFAAGDQLVHSMNTLVAEKVRTFEASKNAVLSVRGNLSLNHLVLDEGGILDLAGSGNEGDIMTVGDSALSGKPGRLANLVSSESALFHAGSMVRVDSTTLTAIAGLPGLKTGTSSLEAESVDGKFDLVETLEKAETDATNRFVLVLESEQKIGSVSGVYGAEHVDIVDESGNLVTTGDYAIDVFEKDGTTEAARFEGALKLVTDREGAWLGQDVARAYLKKDTVLRSDTGTYDVKVALFGEESVNLFATDGTVRLTNGLGSIAGSVVANGGELVLAASGALGNLEDDRAVPTLLSARSGSITVGGAESGAAVEQSVRALEVAAEGELRLNDGSVLAIAGNGMESVVSGRIAAEDDARIELAGTRLRLDASADTLVLSNTLWKMDDVSTLVVDYGVDTSDETRTLTAAEVAVTGGTLAKTGSGRVDFASGVFEAGTTALSVEAGNATVSDWDRSQAADAAGDKNARVLRLAGLSIAEGATFTMNGSLLELVGRNDKGLAKTGSLKNSGTLVLAPKRKSDTATNFAIRHIYGNYVGQGGTIDVRAALGTENADKKGTATVGITSDALVVHGRATGSVLFSIDLQHEELDRGALERMVLLRATDGGDLTYALADGPIESGGFTYFAADTEAPDGGRDYILTSYGEDGVKTVSPDRGAYLGISASTRMFGLSLHDRLGLRPYIDPFTGEVKQTALWMHESVSHTKSHDDTGSVGIRSTTSTTFLGTDVVRLTPSFGGILHAGVMGAYGMSDVKASGSISNSGADVDGWSAGLYVGWNAAEYAEGLLSDPTGPYASAWMQYSSFTSEVTNNRSSIDVDGRGWSASVELGWVLPALSLGTSGTQTASVRFEPRFQATWFGASYDDVETADHDRIAFGGENTVETELGLRAAFDHSALSGAIPYAEVNWVHRTKDATARINGTLKSREAGADNLVEAAVGSTLPFTKSLSGYGEFRIRKGDSGYTAREGNLGVRWKF